MKQFVSTKSLALAMSLLSLPAVAQAGVTAGGQFPWDTPLTNIRENLTGTVGPIIIVMAIVAVGILASMGAHHGIIGRGAAVVFGGALVFGFVAFMSAVGWAGALV